MGRGRPWGVQGSSPSLWGRSGDHRNAKRIPGREGWPGSTFHEGRRRGLHCGPCVVTLDSGGPRGLSEAELTAHRTTEQPLPSLGLAVSRGTLSLPALGLSVFVKHGVQTRKVLFQPQRWFKTKQCEWIHTAFSGQNLFFIRLRKEARVGARRGTSVIVLVYHRHSSEC